MPDTDMFRSDFSPENSRLDFPPEYGRSNLSIKALNPSLELWTDILDTHYSAEMTGACIGDFYCLSFCLSEGLEWNEQISNTSFRLDKDEGAFLSPGRDKGNLYYRFKSES